MGKALKKIFAVRKLECIAGGEVRVKIIVNLKWENF